jgi:hypothetical protein
MCVPVEAENPTATSDGSNMNGSVKFALTSTGPIEVLSAKCSLATSFRVLLLKLMDAIMFPLRLNRGKLVVLTE